MAKTEITPKIAEMVKASGIVDERGIMFLANMAACKIPPEPDQPAYSGAGLLLSPGMHDCNFELCFLALKGDVISVKAYVKSGIFGVSLSQKDLANCTEIKTGYVKKAEVNEGVRVLVDLKTDERLGILLDKNNTAAVKELVKALGF